MFSVKGGKKCLLDAASGGGVLGEAEEEDNRHDGQQARSVSASQPMTKKQKKAQRKRQRRNQAKSGPVGPTTSVPSLQHSHTALSLAAGFGGEEVEFDPEFLATFERLDKVAQQKKVIVQSQL